MATKANAKRKSPLDKKRLNPKDILHEHAKQAELEDKAAEAAAAKEAGNDERDAEIQAVLDQAHRDLYTVPRASELGVFPETAGDKKDFWAEQANWVRRTGETPLEFLVRSYRNPLVDYKVRVAAARAAQELVHSKLPSLAIVAGDEDGVGQRGDATSLRERIIERVLGLAREPQAAGEGGPERGAPGTRKAKR